MNEPELATNIMLHLLRRARTVAGNPVNHRKYGQGLAGRDARPKYFCVCRQSGLFGTSPPATSRRPVSRMPAHPTTSPDPELELPMRRAHSATGVAYRVCGEGEPLVLFHGGAGSWTHWFRNIGPLSERFRVIAVDSPGYGDSDTVDRSLDVDAYLALVVAAIEEACAGAPRIHVSGFSFGSVIGSGTAAALGARAGSLSLIGAAGFGPPVGRDLGLDSRRRFAERLGRTPSPAEVREMHRQNLLKLMILHPHNVDETAVDIQTHNVERARFDSRPLSWTGRTPGFLSDAACPLMVLYGEHDQSAYPSVAARIGYCRDARPDLRVEIVPDIGHWTQYEAAEAVNHALIGFHDRATGNR